MENFKYGAMAFIIAIAIYVLSVVVYRLLLHPLAQYPGPFMAKLTDAHAAYHAWKGDLHLEFWRNHERYGRFVRYGPNSISVNSNTALSDIYGCKANVKKSRFYTMFNIAKDSSSTHSCIDKAQHARKRRVLAQGLSTSAVKAMEDRMTVHLRTFCNQLHTTTPDSANYPDQKVTYRQWGPPQNMAEWCSYLGYDAMGEMAFGKSFDMLRSVRNRFVIDLMADSDRVNFTCAHMPMLQKLRLGSVLFGKLTAGKARFQQYCMSQLTERTRRGVNAEQPDLFYHLLKAVDPETGKGFGMSELWGESRLVISAGSDTTATAFAATIFYLIHNPARLAELVAEVRAIFVDVEQIRSGPQLNGCVYLRACIDEALRLSPPALGLLPREALVGGIDIDNHHFPAGTVVGTPIYTLHHNEDYYTSPFTYNPSRWIVDPNKPAMAADVALARSAFCSFSVGPRSCVGKGFAYMELMLGLARLVWMYDMRLSPGSNVGEGDPEWEWGRRRRGEYQLKDTFAAIRDGPLVEFKPK